MSEHPLTKGNEGVATNEKSRAGKDTVEWKMGSLEELFGVLPEPVATEAAGNVEDVLAVMILAMWNLQWEGLQNSMYRTTADLTAPYIILANEGPSVFCEFTAIKKKQVSSIQKIPTIEFPLPPGLARPMRSSNILLLLVNTWGRVSGFS